jgi:diguanylate cyclase (GGDEF)-like protein
MFETFGPRDVGAAGHIKDVGLAIVEGEPPGVLWREVFQQVSVGLALVDAGGVPVSINAHLKELLGPRCRDIVRLTMQPRLAVLGENPAVVQLDERVVARVEPVVFNHDHAEPQRFFVVHVVPTQGTDPLTGLATRDQLMAELLRLLGRRDARVVDLVMLDVDRFKEINDRHGHLVGDELLTSVADRLLATVRPQDMVCRWGGDEFIVVLDDPGESLGDAVCARIAEAIEVPVHTRAGTLTVSVSCGVVRAQQGEGPNEVLDRADRQMYEAKRQSRGNSGADRAIEVRERTRRNEERTTELTELVTTVRGRIARAREEMGRGPLR